MRCSSWEAATEEGPVVYTGDAEKDDEDEDDEDEDDEDEDEDDDEDDHLDGSGLGVLPRGPGDLRRAQSSSINS
jgi:hypothetical protein